MYGRTPLHLAAAVDYAEMVEYLVENGEYKGGISELVTIYRRNMISMGGVLIFMYY